MEDIDAGLGALRSLRRFDSSVSISGASRRSPTCEGPGRVLARTSKRLDIDM